MGKIVISTNSSFDGVVQDPDGKDGFALGGWFNQVLGEDQVPWAGYFAQEALAADALLLGRTSDEWFAERWLDRAGEWADKLNGMPKFVVSSTLEQTAWSNGTVVNGDLARVVAELKRRFAGDILVYGSFQLGHALFEQDLVDEVRLLVMPVVVGEGVRLFGTAGGVKPLRLVRSATVGEGILSVAYEVVKQG
jgi:dihydrofolate reductase